MDRRKFLLYLSVLSIASCGSESEKNDIKAVDKKNKTLAVVFNEFTVQAYSELEDGRSLYNIKTDPAYVNLKRQLPSRGYGNYLISYKRFTELLRSKGYDVIKLTDRDLDSGNIFNKQFDLLILFDHSEYWSYTMKENFDAYVKQGKNVLILSGNNCYWKVRINDNRMVCYKFGSADPIQQKEYVTGKFISLSKTRNDILPEYLSTGLAFDYAGYPVKRKLTLEQSGLSREVYYQDTDKMFVLSPNHAVYEKTKLSYGDGFGGDIGLVFKEVDGLPMTSDYQLDKSRLIPDYTDLDIVPLAWCWSTRNGKTPHKSICAVEYRKGDAKIINFGTMGWSNLYKKSDSDSEKIMLNSITYLLS